MRAARSRRARRRALWAARLGQGLTVASVLTAGVWALVEYAGSQEAERTKYTLQLVESWEKDGYGRSYNILRQDYEDFVGRLSAGDLDLARRKDQARRNVLNRFAAYLAEDDARTNRVRSVVYFFNKLSLCEQSAVCSRETLRIFFADTVRSFVSVFQPYLDKHAGNLPGDRTSLSDFSRRLGGTETAETAETAETEGVLPPARGGQ